MKLNEVKAPAIDPNSVYGRNKIQLDQYKKQISDWKKKLKDAHKKAQDCVRQTAVNHGFTGAMNDLFLNVNSEMRRLHDRGGHGMRSVSLPISRRRSQLYFVDRKYEQSIIDLYSICLTSLTNIRILTRHAKPYAKRLKGTILPAHAPRGLQITATPQEQKKIIGRKMSRWFQHAMMIRLAILRNPDVVQVVGRSYAPLKPNVFALPDMRGWIDFLEKSEGWDAAGSKLRRHLPKDIGIRMKYDAEVETKQPGDLDPLVHRFEFALAKYKDLQKQYVYLDKLIKQDQMNERGW